MTVYCPYCSTGYLLPDSLMGPSGARVRCPQCGKAFVVLRDGDLSGRVAEANPPAAAPGVPDSPAPEASEPAEAAPAVLEPVDAVPEAPGPSEAALPASEPSEAAPAGADEPPGDGSPGQIAAAVLADLATRLGPDLEKARQGGRLFAEHGPALMEAFDEYRRRAGKIAGTEAFRAALRERWGVELPAGPERDF